MTSHNLGGNYWGYLIKADKSAAPLLEQLCLGLAKIIGALEPRDAGPEKELTPQRLALFYREVGGNYDALFLGTSNGGLSNMYKILGCFHSLQPTATPFESPAIPALTPEGFARWQTIQIMLCPGDAVPFLQEAVRRYEIPRPDGSGTFPKRIPKEAFPERPDAETEIWYNDIQRRLNFEQERHQRLKNSPYASPYEGPDRNLGYFAPNSRLGLPQINRPSRPSRHGSQDYDLARRRSSVPDLPSPVPDSAAWVKDSSGRPVDKKRTSRSHSAHRPSNSSTQHRPSNGSGHRPSNAAQKLSNPPTPSRPTPDPFYQHNGAVQAQQGRPPHPPRHRHRAGNAYQRSPSTIDESSGSEASSEDSITGRRQRRKPKREEGKRSSLWPGNLVPSGLLSPHHKRRHSHDASYNSPEKAPALPPRPTGRPHDKRNGSTAQDSPVRNGVPNGYSPASPRPPPNGLGINTVQFRDHIWNNVRDDALNSAPENSPVYPYNIQSRVSISQQGVPPPPQNPHLLMGAENPPLTREGSRSGSSGDSANRATQRASGRPLRVQTVSGVGGRQYPEARSAVGPRRSVAPMPV